VNTLSPTAAVAGFQKASSLLLEARVALTIARRRGDPGAIAQADADYRTRAFIRDQALEDCRAAFDPQGPPVCA
jgi:hypothetical protein